jgi:hypothetical protein
MGAAYELRTFTPTIRSMYNYQVVMMDGAMKDPTGDDAEGRRAISVEQIAPTLIGSSMLEQTHASVADQVDIAATSTSGQKRKCPLPVLCTANTEVR